VTPQLSIVVPVFNEQEVLRPFHAELTEVMEGTGLPYELLLVNDGSKDESLAIMLELHRADSRVSLLDLSRNYGHQVAITAGLDHARGEAVIVMDADLQDPPHVIPDMLEKYNEGFDVVYGVRETRAGETVFKRGTAWLFYRGIRAMTGVDMPLDTGDFRLMSRRAVVAMRRLREQNPFVRGMAHWIGFRQTGVLYERSPRFAGRTKYPLRKMLQLAIDAVVSFSMVPLRLSMLLGATVAFASFLYAAYAVVQVLRGDVVHGWASTIVAILLVGGMNLLCLGILGEYVGRVYQEVRARPLYLVSGLERRESVERDQRVG
jgi:polyisoprenyl-phosphate glycosyltransferase